MLHLLSFEPKPHPLLHVITNFAPSMHNDFILGANVLLTFVMKKLRGTDTCTTFVPAMARCVPLREQKSCKCQCPFRLNRTLAKNKFGNREISGECDRAKQWSDRSYATTKTDRKIEFYA